jgi:hypothetical protein
LIEALPRLAPHPKRRRGGGGFDGF